MAIVRYAVVIERGPTSYGAYLPDLPGCVAVAENEDEVRQLIREAVHLYLEEMRLDGDPITPPTSQVEYVEIADPAPQVA